MSSPNSANIARLQMLTEEQIEQIHYATLEILERTGVRIDHAEALELLRGNGARIMNDGRVRIPAHLVEQALRTVPPRVVLCNRDGERALFLEEGRSYFGSSSDCPDFLDPVTGMRREFVADDGRITALVADYLPNIHFVNRAGWAADLPRPAAEWIQFKQLLTIVRKPIGVGSPSIDTLIRVIQMAEIIAGGREQLRQHPFIYCTAEPISPLTHAPLELSRMMLCAERGVPLVCYPMPMLGSTAPATFAGTLALGNAEILSGLVIHQLKAVGAPFIYGSISTIMDMRTSICSYGAPEMDLMVAAMTELAHHYRLPMFGTAGCTDAKGVDQQAAAEASVSCLMSILSGANLIHDVGLIDHCTAISPEMMVLADEIIEMTCRATQSIAVDRETLALDVIESVGPGGHYLLEPHTLQHFRQVWYPKLFSRGGYEAERETTLSARLRQEVLEIVRTHEPRPLSEDVARELDAMEGHWLT